MTDFTPLNRVPAYVELAEAITARILNGDIHPGDLLPIEQELAEQFSVNRSTLREGLRVLEESGLVRRKGKRLVVQRPSHRSLALVTGRALVLHEVSFNDIYELGSLLFPAAAELAAKHMTNAHKTRLKENLELTKKALNDPEELALIDIQFLQLIAEASGNKAMLISLEPLNLIFYAGFNRILTGVPVAAKRLLESHTRIYIAICNKDTAKARKWMEKHVNDFKRAFEFVGISMNDKIGDSELVISTLQQRRH